MSNEQNSTATLKNLAHNVIAAAWAGKLSDKALIWEAWEALKETDDCEAIERASKLMAGWILGVEDLAQVEIINDGEAAQTADGIIDLCAESIEDMMSMTAR